MPHIHQTQIGIAILLLLGILVVVKRLATGTVFDKPGGGFLVRLVNSYNLCFLLAVNPLAAILLITRQEGTGEAASAMVQILGLATYGVGVALMAWALICLRANYQLGGSAPRPGDTLVVSGPYRLVRHPMYAAAVGICLGLAGLMGSWALLGVGCIYLVLILRLIPVEEDGLRAAYGDSYGDYRRRTRRLLPWVY